jgi:hypothetical protein
VQAVGRSHQVSLALAAALAWSGCLLFSDPINKAPTVTVTTNDDPIYRNQTATFFATVADDQDPSTALKLRWCEFDADGQGSCNSVPTAWPAACLDLRPSSATYTFKPQTVATTCVCAQVVDSKGATGQGCAAPVTPINPAPIAIITDDSGALSNRPRSMCSSIRLSAESSESPSGDPLQFEWTLEYSGGDPVGKSVQLAACDGVTTNTQAHRCFFAIAQGTYTVLLTASARPDPTSTPTSSTSEPFVIPVGADAPPCIRRTLPDAHSQLVVLSRSSDLGTRTFKVLSVDDDCEPYPAVAGSKGVTQFAWSVLDTTSLSSSGTPTWVPQTDTGVSFDIGAAQFPSARPGDTIKVRLEVRDTEVQKLYANHGTVCADDSIDYCCAPNDCTGGPDDCLRWATWTVQFQP